MRREAFLSIGTSSGDRRQNLRTAVGAFPEVLAVSPVYESEPLLGNSETPYLSLVIHIRTSMEALELVDLCRDLEEEATGLNAEDESGFPLKIEILMMDDTEINAPNLTLPHPKMNERRYILAPLSDIAPDRLPHAWQSKALGHVNQVGGL